ncbi:hypothetical protein [Curtobacterium sp. 24E2]|nr:hypothetical protein JN350_00910 [Curtobacterium sp. 24E2]
MTALKTGLAVVRAAISAAVVILLSAMVVTTLAVSTGGSVAVPGMVEATAGSGADLATTQLHPGAPIWLIGITLVLTTAILLLQRRRNSQHAEPSGA